LKAKGNLKVVTERVGHASVSLTFDVYSHVLPDMQQTVNESLKLYSSGKPAHKWRTK
jgi:integrase